MKTSIIISLAMLIFTSFTNKQNDGMANSFSSNNYVVFSHKQQKIIEDNLMCNATIYYLQNSVLFNDNDIDNFNKEKYIFRKLKEVTKKLKSGNKLTKLIYTCERDLQFGNNVINIVTITKLKEKIISFGFRDSEFANEKVYYVENSGSIGPGYDYLIGH
jgi:hypothetical protein